eukprot:Rmarinus@m.20878
MRNCLRPVYESEWVRFLHDSSRKSPNRRLEQQNRQIHTDDAVLHSTPKLRRSKHRRPETPLQSILLTLWGKLRKSSRKNAMLWVLGSTLLAQRTCQSCEAEN